MNIHFVRVSKNVEYMSTYRLNMIHYFYISMQFAAFLLLREISAERGQSWKFKE